MVPWKARLWHRLVKPKSLIKNAAHLFAVSETTKRDLTRLLGIDPARITVIPMGLDRAEPSFDSSFTLQVSRYILCLGGSNARKNASCISTAHAELIKDPKYKDVELVMIGSPNTSRPSDAELFTLMRDAAIFCYPSCTRALACRSTKPHNSGLRASLRPPARFRRSRPKGRRSPHPPNRITGLKRCVRSWTILKNIEPKPYSTAGKTPEGSLRKKLKEIAR
jgi:hypothetical protein